MAAISKRNPVLAASAKSIDPTLDALFASSSGPVKALPKPRTSIRPRQGRPEPSEAEESLSIPPLADSGGEDDDSSSPLEDNSENESDISGLEKASPVHDLDSARRPPQALPKRERKRKRKDDDDFEGKYLQKLADRNESDVPAGKKQRHVDGNVEPEDTDARDGSTTSDEDDGGVPLHESITTDSKTVELEKAGRTVFLSNVNSEAITSKAQKKALLVHLSSILDTSATPPEKLESIRFRSIAFSSAAMPKRAAFITKSLMGETTKSANAYAVYSTAAAARRAVTALNGTVTLGRHLRVDSVAHPSQTDHRRCVFVGNLTFIDDETVVSTDKDGNATEKKRSKTPADAEEGLWRTFGTHAGKVENVRVIRDPKTRVGKGFAYVQFHDANDVESALLLDGKKFPPMLPRQLRVTRAKDPRKTAKVLDKSRAKALVRDGVPGSTKYNPKVTPEAKSTAGRVTKLLGRSGGARHQGSPRSASANMFRTPEQIVFEGKRASAADGRPRDLKLGRKPKQNTGGGKSTGRRRQRAADWKKKTSATTA